MRLKCMTNEILLYAIRNSNGLSFRLWLKNHLLQMKNLTLKTLGRHLGFGVHCALRLTIVFSKAHEAEMYDRMKRWSIF